MIYHQQPDVRFRLLNSTEDGVLFWAEEVVRCARGSFLPTGRVAVSVFNGSDEPDAPWDSDDGLVFIDRPRLWALPNDRLMSDIKSAGIPRVGMGPLIARGADLLRAIRYASGQLSTYAAGVLTAPRQEDKISL